MTDEPRLAAALADRYRIERELGQGGMATVYLAQDLKHHRHVAIKVLHAELSAVLGSERFVKEIELTANLQHPHILPLFDSGSADGLLFYVMPFVEGESLRARLTREKQLPVTDAVRIATEVADALGYAHAKGIVHRDIKPENILLRDGHALVADFGIALAVEQAGGQRMTQTGLSLGTPQYMSPEQAMGEREIGARSDLYSLGAVTYEMLAGEPPFTGPSAQAIVARVMTEEPRGLTAQRRSVPPHVDAAVRTALEKLPADRFGTAAEYTRALTAPAAATASNAVGRSLAGAGSRRWTPLAVAGWSAASLFAVAAIALWLRRPPVTPAPVTRFDIPIPATLGETQAQLSTSIAVAPDGSLMAYIAAGPLGRSQIFVRRRDETDAHALAGTDGAASPFFSPDARWIGYFSDNRLYKISASGDDAPIPLADSVNMTAPGGAWLADGRILFSSRAFGLDEVPANGGPIRHVLRQNANGDGWTLPQPLPEPDAVLATLCSNNCARLTLVQIDLRTGRADTVLPGVKRGWYLPTGDLVYADDAGTVFALPFDPRHPSHHGPSRPVLRGVQIVEGIPEMDLSKDGTLIYVAGAGARDEVRLVRVDRSGRAASVDSAWSGGFGYMALSPDGRRIAIDVSSGAHTDIWVRTLDDGPLTRLTFEGSLNYRPAWLPDGRTVSFTSDRSNRSLLWRAPADGSSPAALVRLRDTSQVDEAEWSRDGRWLVYRAGIYDGQRRVRFTPASGDSAWIQLPGDRFDTYGPALSPDGRFLAYVSAESGREEVYVRPFPNVTDARWQVSAAGGSQPVWAHTGRSLFYTSANNGSLMEAPVAEASNGAFRAGVPRALFAVSRFRFNPFHTDYAVEPDDDHFLFAEPVAAPTSQDHLTVVLNWFQELGHVESATGR